ncbi:hypothetical protein SAMN05421813_1632 [Daejeonella rubra]|uniref:CHAP domain-containing protein n=1 Tax=Daejeonella rubra TaxID=990371 RepID=A0A1G9Z8V6_9SPHI|nr:hypothetical protein [Daejeonella rubra]SDN17799.1 hypothetical protein SAMN05421813_1632 [Daejeonella rubra]
MKTSDKHHYEILKMALIKPGIAILIFFVGMIAFGLKAQEVQMVSSLKATELRVRQIYTSQIGIREKHSNSGAEVEKYLRYVNLPKGNPWCAAFVCWVFGQANVENPRTGWSPDLFKGSKVIWDKVESRKLKAKSLSGESGNMRQDPIAIGSRKYAYPTSQTTDNRQQVTPGTGDIFGIYFPDKKRIAHIGFIDQWQEDWVITVEGNTNMEGSREGDGVYRKRRPVKSIYQVARYIR